MYACFVNVQNLSAKYSIMYMYVDDERTQCHGTLYTVDIHVTEKYTNYAQTSSCFKIIKRTNLQDWLDLERKRVHNSRDTNVDI